MALQTPKRTQLKAVENAPQKVEQTKDKKQLSLYVTQSEYQFLKKLKQEKMISASTFIRQLLQDYIENQSKN